MTDPPGKVPNGLMPVLFIGHGSPMLAIEDSIYRRSWMKLGQILPRPRAILCISAHWTTRGTHVTGAEHPPTIHDFYGFPQALYDRVYAAPGSSDLVRRICALGGSRIRIDSTRGLDHGAWTVLSAMYPAADVPVVQMSLDLTQPAAGHFELARHLAPLREEGILVLGSGNIVHNLGAHDRGDPEPRGWAVRFDAWVRQCIETARHDAVLDYQQFGPQAALSVPTPEHFLPLIHVLAMVRPGETLQVFNAEVRSAVSMTSYLFGAGAGAGAGAVAGQES